jgi:hypothetical protein
MSLIQEGKIVEAILTFTTIAMTMIILNRASAGKSIPIRWMSQIDAMGDGVNKALEEGKPVFVTVGCYAYLSGIYAAMTIAGLNVTRYIAKLCVGKGAEVRFPISKQPECLPIIDGIYREVCVSEGKPEAYVRDNVQYFGGHGYSTGISGWVAREGCSLYVMVGALGGTSADVDGLCFAKMSGALSTGGTGRWAHQGTWAVLTDYPMFTDDIYAVGALCAEDEVMQSTIAGGDFVKIAMIIFTLIGLIAVAAGIPFDEWMTT